MRARAALTLVETPQMAETAQVVHEGRFWTEDDESFHPLHRSINFSNRVGPGFAEFILSGYSSPGDIVFFDGCANGVPIFQGLNMSRVCIGFDRSPINAFVSAAKIGAVGFDEVVLRLSQLKLKAPADISDYSLGFDQFYHVDTFIELLNLRRAVVLNPDDRVIRSIGLLALSRLVGHTDSYFSIYSSPHKQNSPEEQKKLNLSRRAVPSYAAVAPRILKRAAELLGAGLTQAFFTASSLSYISANRDTLLRSRAAGGIELVINSNTLPYEKDETTGLWLTSWFLGLDSDWVSPTEQARGLSSSVWSDELKSSLEFSLKTMRTNGAYVLCLGAVPDGLGIQALQQQAERVATSVRVNNRRFRVEDVVVNRSKSNRPADRASDGTVVRDRFLVLRVC
jgi:hypothetical protein